MLLTFLRSGNISSAIIYLLSSLFVVFCVLPIHEYAHALVATKLGDNTARASGRLTINPLAHIDKWGALMIVLVGFGWARPVPVNMRNFNKPKRDMALTALAGPISNIIVAFITMVLFFAIGKITFLASPQVLSWLEYIFSFMSFIIQINISLAVFNLLPIPPLDGSRIISLLIPDKYYYRIMQYERYISIGLMALLLFGGLSRPINFLSTLLTKLLAMLAGLPFGNF